MGKLCQKFSIRGENIFYFVFLSDHVFPNRNSNTHIFTASNYILFHHFVQRIVPTGQRDSLLIWYQISNIFLLHASNTGYYVHIIIPFHDIKTYVTEKWILNISWDILGGDTTTKKKNQWLENSRRSRPHEMASADASKAEKLAQRSPIIHVCWCLGLVVGLGANK